MEDTYIRDERIEGSSTAETVCDRAAGRSPDGFKTIAHPDGVSLIFTDVDPSFPITERELTAIEGFLMQEVNAILDGADNGANRKASSNQGDDS